MKLEGEIDDEQEQQDDMKEGRFAWRIAPNGKSPEGSSSEQIAWLQYSSTMYRESLLEQELLRHVLMILCLQRVA